MKIIDFRFRPPFASFSRLGIFNPNCNERKPQKWHGRPSESARNKSMSLFWNEAKRAGIIGGVAMGRKLPDESLSVENRDIIELARQYPNKIIPFLSVDISQGVKAAMKELRQYLDMGAKGIAMEPAYAFPPHKADDNVLYPIYAFLEEAGLPVVLTMSFLQNNLDYSDPVAVQHVARDFPDLQIVLAHACYPWIPQVIQLAVCQDNIWLLPDIYMLNPQAPGNEMYGQALYWLNGEKMLFGTAYPCYNLEQAVEDIRRFNFPEDLLEKFFYKNAESLLNITFSE